MLRLHRLSDDQKVALRRLSEEKYGDVICYPECMRDEFDRRLEELKKLGVKAIEFLGEKTVCNQRVLGKGNVGIVVKAHLESGRVALKIRRTDADRATMMHEANMLQKANSVNVGPRLLGATANFLVMEYVDGKLLPEWVQSFSEGDASERLRRVLRSVLQQAWRLDEAKLDHGELSNAAKHVIVRADDEPCLVDFETASIMRRVSNVTSLCQFLLLRSSTAELVKKKLGHIDEVGLLEALRRYKCERSGESFSTILNECRV
jgi:putative serine/threonine protein kinase